MIMRCHPERSEGPHKLAWVTQGTLDNQPACVRSLARARDDREIEDLA